MERDLKMKESSPATQETSYTSLAQEIAQHSHFIQPSPEYETEYEARYVHDDSSETHSNFMLKSLSPRRHAQRVQELWNRLQASVAELLNHHDVLDPILHLTTKEVRDQLLNACEEIKNKQILGPYVKHLYRAFSFYTSHQSGEDEERKHRDELYTNIDNVLVNNEILNYVHTYQKLIAESAM